MNKLNAMLLSAGLVLTSGLAAAEMVVIVSSKNAKETLNNSQHSRVRRLVSECGVKFCDFCPELRHFLHYSPVFRI